MQRRRRPDLTKLVANRIENAVLRTGGQIQDVLAEAGIDPSQWSRLRRAHYLPGAETLLGIADATGVSVDYLLGRVDDPAGYWRRR